MDNSAQKKQYWFVIRELTSREIKRKYARSKLGIVWSVLNPLLQMTVLSLVFSQMFKRSIENFPIYYLCGYIIWNLFTTATNTSMTTLVDNKNMLIKVKFPMELLIFSRVYTAFTNFLYSLIAFALMICVFRVWPSLHLFFFPVIVVFVLLFAMGMSYVLSTGYVFFGDVKYLYSVLLTLWMYLSAIFYPVTSLPDVMQKVVQFNPIFIYIDSLRDLVLYHTLPAGRNILEMAIFSGGMYLVGHIVFHKNKNKIMQKI